MRLIFLITLCSFFSGNAWSLTKADCDLLEKSMMNIWESCFKNTDCDESVENWVSQRGAFYAGLYLSFCDTRLSSKNFDQKKKPVKENSSTQMLSSEEIELLLPHI